jgi:hypothetical protein
MTSTVTEVTTATIMLDPFDSLSATVGIIIILLLLLLMFQKELIRVSGGRRARLWMRALDLAIVPLLLTFGLIIVRRFLDLLY